MNEKTPLIGTPVNLTVFRVDYEYKKAPRVAKLPKSAKKEQEKVGPNTLFVCSSDPSGQDVYEIVKRRVLGPTPYEGHDFRLLQQQRALDVSGTATVTSWELLDGNATESPVNTEEESEEEEGDGGGDPPVSSLN